MLLQHHGRAIQCRGQHGNLLLCEFQIATVNRFIHSRNHDCCVASVLAGSVNRMVIPRTIGQPLGNQQRPFGVAQSCVQTLRVSGQFSFAASR